MKKQKRSQADAILAHLQKRPITQLQALQSYGCLRLASRINELKKEGHVIESKRIKTKGGSIVSRYTLLEPAPSHA